MKLVVGHVTINHRRVLVKYCKHHLEAIDQTPYNTLFLEKVPTCSQHNHKSK